MMSISQSTANPITVGQQDASRIAENAKQRKAFVDIGSDLKSGDLDSAKQAFSTLTQNVPAAVLSNPNTALGQLNQALQTGDTAAASTALSNVASNVHAHRESKAPVASAGPISIPTTATTSSTGGTAGTVLNEVA